jgi:glycerophosphoryl diester phosphodiesterase
MSRLITRFLQIILPCIVLIHTVLFILYWSTNNLFYAETNDYLTKKIGMRMDYISICLLISGLIAVWSVARLYVYKKGIKHKLGTVTTVLYTVVALIFIAFFYGSFWLLFSESPVQLPRIAQMISYFRWFVDTTILLGAALGLGFWVRGALLGRKAAEKSVGFFPILISLLIVTILWIVPLIFPPDSIFRGDLPPKPLIIAHRGASMVAPENTISSFILAADLGVYGLETDIHISNDGQPFLLHDDTFVRTTDVEERFPERATDRAEYFTLAEAIRLNAGKWFVERDPYGTINNGQVSDPQIDEYMLQTIPTLADVLGIVRENRLAFIFDIKQPPEDQDYAQSFFEICLNEIHDAGIDAQVWFLADKDQSELVQSTAPEMKLAYGVDYQSPPTAEELNIYGYQMANAEYGLSEDWIRKYQDGGLWVNLYTIDEPWQYSRLWLMGVDSTTTSNAHTMVGLNHPVMSLPFEHYLLLWSLVGIASLGLVLGLTIPVYRHLRTPES